MNSFFIPSTYEYYNRLISINSTRHQIDSTRLRTPPEVKVGVEPSTKKNGQILSQTASIHNLSRLYQTAQSS